MCPGVRPGPTHAAERLSRRHAEGVERRQLHPHRGGQGSWQPNQRHMYQLKTDLHCIQVKTKCCITLVLLVHKPFLKQNTPGCIYLSVHYVQPLWWTWVWWFIQSVPHTVLAQHPRALNVYNLLLKIETNFVSMILMSLLGTVYELTIKLQNSANLWLVIDGVWRLRTKPVQGERENVRLFSNIGLWFMMFHYTHQCAGVCQTCSEWVLLNPLFPEMLLCLFVCVC